jgi:tetratricopeptide (TPR) repeat protein
VASGADSGSSVLTRGDGRSLEASILLLSERGCGDVSGRRFERDALEAGLSRLTGRVDSILAGSREPGKVLDAIGRVLFDEGKYAYDASGTDADLYLLDRVIERKRGNCLGLTLLYALIGERLGVPVTGSYVPGHIFVRYEGQEGRFNRETSLKGREMTDSEYRRRFALDRDRPYLKTLDKGELAGILAKTMGASCSCGRKDETAIRYYEEASRLYPDLADIYFNTGVSLQRTGKPGEAIRQYRKSLAIDPGLSAARGNLGHAERQEAASCDFRNPPGGTGGNEGPQRR